MRRYKVILDLSRDQFVDFIDGKEQPALDSVTFTGYEDGMSDFADGKPLADVVHELHPKRAPRGSKVNTAILGALKEGNKSTKDLKEALESAGLSPGSLSTGIAQLQRTGEIERAEEGVYRLGQVQQAA